MKNWKNGLIALAAVMLLTACAGPENGNTPTQESSSEAETAWEEEIVGKNIDELKDEPVKAEGQWIKGADGQKYLKQSATFYNSFDTIIDVTYFTQDEKEFDRYLDFTYKEYQRLHRLFDTFHNYEGLVNAKTVNDKAGGDPVKVPDELFDLVSFSLDHRQDVLGKVNIGIGRAVSLWNQAREEKKLPDPEKLKGISAHVDPSNILLDPEKKTIQITDPEMAMDLGAVAKGYATEKIAQELETMGLKHGLISAGGNVRTIGGPIDGREEWSVGIADPRADEESALACVVKVGADMSVVTSGDYQRYFIVDGVRYHHILDPKSLSPLTLYPSVTVISPDSGLADLLSTAFFLSNKEEAEEIRKNFPGQKIDLIWVDKDEKISCTPDIEAKVSLPN